MKNAAHAWARKRLTSIETKSKMWGSPDTIEFAYLEILCFLLVLDGHKQPDPKVNDAYLTVRKRLFPMINPQVPAYSVGFTRDDDGDRTYSEETYTNLVKFLKELRTELGYPDSKTESK